MYGILDQLNVLDISEIFKNVLDDNKVNNNEEFKSPVYDIIYNNYESYVVKFYLAGFKKKDISLEVEDDTIILTALREDNTNKYHRKQSFFGKYKKIFSLPDDVDINAISSKFEDGVLIVTIPLLPEEPKTQRKLKIE